MDADALKLTTYLGERSRTAHGLTADALLDVYHRHGFATSVLLRGIEGFGLKHHLRSQRLLTLSEDLPVVTVAVDTRPRIEAALPAISELMPSGLVTLERARMLRGAFERVELPAALHEATKLTVYVGRQERAGGRPAFVAVVDLLQRHGIAGATALLGVDGTAHGERERARFFGRNAEVPMMIVSVGDGARIAAALPDLRRLLDRPLVTLERVRVCKRDGRMLAEPTHLPETDASGLGLRQKLMVHASEQAHHEGSSIYVEIVRRLRAAGAAGATVLRGVWGYHGDHAPHGDRLLALRRHVPVVAIVVDSPEQIRRWFAVVDQLTAETGLVTSEMVPAFRAVGPGTRRGGLTLADHGY